MNPVEDFLAEKNAAGFLGSLWEGVKGGVRLGDLAATTGGAQRLGHILGNLMTTGAATAAVTAGTHAIGNAASSLTDSVRERINAPADYKAMMSAQPNLAHEDAGQVQMVYNSLRHLSPTMASDPLLAGSFVRQIMANAPHMGVAITADTAKALAEIESKSRTKAEESPVAEAFLKPFGGLHDASPFGRDEALAGAKAQAAQLRLQLQRLKNRGAGPRP